MCAVNMDAHCRCHRCRAIGRSAFPDLVYSDQSATMRIADMESALQVPSTLSHFQIGATSMTGATMVAKPPAADGHYRSTITRPVENALYCLESLLLPWAPRQ